jgi:hypothetical protein
MSLFSFGKSNVQFKNFAPITPTNFSQPTAVTSGGDFVWFAANGKITRIGKSSINQYTFPVANTIDAIVFYNNTLFAFVGNIGIYTSGDQGQTWALLLATLTTDYAGAASNGKGTIVAVVVGVTNTLISTNGGISFASSGGSNLNVLSPATSATVRYSALADLFIYAGQTGNIYTSATGVSWNLINYPSVVNNAASVEIISPSQFMVSTNGGRLHKGDIRSSSISEISSLNFPYGEDSAPGSSNRISYILKTPNFIYLSNTACDAAVSIDNGSTFQPCSSQIASGSTSSLMGFNSNGVYIGGSGQLNKTLLA